MLVNLLVAVAVYVLGIAAGKSIIVEDHDNDRSRASTSTSTTTVNPPTQCGHVGS